MASVRLSNLSSLQKQNLMSSVTRTKFSLTQMSFCALILACLRLLGLAFCVECGTLSMLLRPLEKDSPSCLGSPARKVLVWCLLSCGLLLMFP